MNGGLASRLAGLPAIDGTPVDPGEAESPTTIAPAGISGTAAAFYASIPQPVRRMSEELLRQAAGEAERLIGDARREADGIRQDAGKNGYADGYEAGCSQARLEQDARSRQLEAHVQAVVADLEQRCRQQIDQLEPEFMELSLQVAEKVIGCELARSDEAFRSLVRIALSRLKQSERVCIRVNETEARLLTDSVAAGLPIENCVQVKGEPQLPAGSCLIETDAGLVDASVPVQMRQIRSSLVEGDA